MNNYNIFGQKIKLLLEKLCKNNYFKLTELLIDMNKPQVSTDNYILNREKNIRKWIRNQSVCSKDFIKSFKNYKINDEIILHNKPLFTIDDFINGDIDNFIYKLDEYLLYKSENNIGLNFDFKYLYIFNDDKDGEYINKIDYYTIHYGQNSSPTEIDITIEVKESTNLYKGTLRYIYNNIDINVTSENNILHMLFNKLLLNSNTKYIYGLSLGISYINQTIPKAKKIILSKTKVNGDDLQELYLSLNETEILEVNENIYHISSRDKFIKYLIEYKDNINNYNKFFTNLKNHYKDLKSNLYYNLAFKELSSINNIFIKLSRGDNFFVNNRIKLFSTFLETMIKTKNLSLYIIFPIFNKENNIFIKQSDEAIKIQDNFMELKKYNIKSIIIFVINTDDNITERFRKRLKLMHDNGIKIKFVLKDNIKYDVISMDFFYTSKKDFVVTNPLRMDNKIFNVSKQLDIINEYITTDIHHPSKLKLI